MALGCPLKKLGADPSSVIIKRPWQRHHWHSEFVVGQGSEQDTILNCIANGESHVVSLREIAADQHRSVVGGSVLFGNFKAIFPGIAVKLEVWAAEVLVSSGGNDRHTEQQSKSARMNPADDQTPAKHDSWNRDQPVAEHKYADRCFCTHAIKDQNRNEGQRCAKQNGPTLKSAAQVEPPRQRGN